MNIAIDRFTGVLIAINLVWTYVNFRNSRRNYYAEAIARKLARESNEPPARTGMEEVVHSIGSMFADKIAEHVVNKSHEMYKEHLQKKVP